MPNHAARSHLRLLSSLVPLALTLAFSPDALAADDPARADAATLATVNVDAQSATDVPTEVSGDYTVRRSSSATGLALSPRETPQSVSTVTRAKMDDFGLTSANDVLETTTGVVVEKVETDRTYYTARGFDITNFQIDGSGVPFTSGNALGDIDTAVYDRVDVVRGASGLLSPTGNPSATVNFISKRPTAEFQTSGSLTFGSWGDKRLDLDVSGPLNEAGTVRGRVVMAKEKSDSWLKRYSHDKTVFYGIIEADLNPDTTLALSYTRQENKADSPLWGGLPLYYSNGSATDYDSSTSTSADWAYWNTRDQRARVELTRRLGGDWKGRVALTLREQRSDGRLFYLYGTPDASTGLGLYSYPSSYVSDLKQTLFNAEASGSFELAGRRHELSFGGMLSRSHMHDRSGYGTIGSELDTDLADWDGSFPASFDSSSDGSDYTDRQLSLYAALRSHLDAATSVIAGASATRADSSGSDYGLAHDASDSAINPYFGLVYDLDRHMSAYGSYTRIFTPQPEKTDASGATLAPVTGWNQELGLKSEWLDKKLQASLAVFRTRQNNLAEQTGMDGTRYVYAGTQVSSRGFEAEISGRPLPGLQASLGYTQLALVDADGDATHTYTPRRLIRASTTYRLPFLERVKVGMNVAWQSRIWRDQGDGITSTQKAYALVDLMTSYDLNKSLTATLRLNNVGNVKYLASLYTTQSYYGAPRNGSVSLSWKY
ncbi:TonB-dependent siderophore receptor [Paludibacterium yongneupense]|uniref:TonB-dependent siderophore receptor n=1 Tax=Paludibacterium yongneupense TaxID=400061 RepID=UPI0009FE3427|nr:TonB-dependent siderophore receptor [Paludibacterium yongneupense]